MENKVPGVFEKSGVDGIIFFSGCSMFSAQRHDNFGMFLFQKRIWPYHTFGGILKKSIAGIWSWTLYCLAAEEGELIAWVPMRAQGLFVGEIRFQLGIGCMECASSWPMGFCVKVIVNGATGNKEHLVGTWKLLLKGRGQSLLLKKKNVDLLKCVKKSLASLLLAKPCGRSCRPKEKYLVVPWRNAVWGTRGIREPRNLHD